jgi:hypothetical protein
MSEPEPRAVNPENTYERSDWPIKAIGVVALIVLAFLAIAPWALFGGFRGSVSDVDRQLAVTPPAPRLQVDPEEDLARLRAAAEARLESYGWVDRQKGVVHIPIEQAMRQVAAKGIDGFPRGPR